MKAISQGLGVRCDYCHVREGQRTDFASDENSHKEIARTMMRMTQQINEDFLNRPGGMRVACVTCHRGVKAPHTLPQLLTKALEEGGVEAMAAKYGDLRQEYYGRAAYDFGEKTLMLMATDVETDVGLRMLRMNLEYYPGSSDTYVQFGNLLIQSGDKDGGIAALEKAIELDPDYAEPYVGLADTYGLLPIYNFAEPSEAMPKAKSYEALHSTCLDMQR